MSYRAIYTYPWDLAETGVEAAISEFEGLGLDTVTMAGAYHAGKFLRPHGMDGKVYFPEDGTVYFRPDLSVYGAIKPRVSALAGERDVLREVTDHGRMATNAWLVLLHNTPLGMQHPDACVRNAFGDPYFYSLSPSHPDARAYALALVRDVVENYPVSGVSLESPGYAPHPHGYHHEFGLVRMNRWLDNLLGLDFSEAAIVGAEAAGIDARRLKAQVAADIQNYLDSDIDFPPDMAEAFWLADVQADGDLRRFLLYRNDVVTSLVREIRAAVRGEVEVAIIPSVARPTGGAWYEGSDLHAIAEAGCIVETCFYEPSAMRVKADLFDVQRRLRGKGKIRGLLRPAFPDLGEKSEFLAAVAALREAGVDELGFYNWGHLRRHNLGWIGEASRGMA